MNGKKLHELTSFFLGISQTLPTNLVLLHEVPQLASLFVGVSQQQLKDGFIRLSEFPVSTADATLLNLYYYKSATKCRDGLTQRPQADSRLPQEFELLLSRTIMERAMLSSGLSHSQGSTVAAARVLPLLCTSLSDNPVPRCVNDHLNISINCCDDQY